MHQSVLHSKVDGSIQESMGYREVILRTLAYFDIFNYPLTKEELFQFAGNKMDDLALEIDLRHLLESKMIFLQQGYYSLQQNMLLIHRRRRGNERAEQLLEKAQRIGRFLYRFPFVRAVAVSGSLSKNFADEKADIDFFIITKANRLWIARTLMHLYKKLTYLNGRQHYYCMNYYVDEEAVQLKERNIYTAIELKTLLPLNGGQTMQAFFDNNEWANEWFPQCPYRQPSQPDPSTGFIKRVLEWMLSNRLLNSVDSFLHKITSKRWQKKAENGKKNMNGRIMELITDKHFTYSNSGSFREKVLSMYEKKLEELGIRG